MSAVPRRGHRCQFCDRRRFRIKPMFAWYDLWVGVFIDRSKRRVYIFPLPCVGLMMSW